MREFNEECFFEFREKMDERIMDIDNLQIKRFFNLDKKVYEEGELDRKTKEMMGLLASLILNCDDCVRYHINELHNLEVTEKELGEIFSISLITGGSVVIPHLRRAVNYWDELKSNTDESKRAGSYEIYTDGACQDNPGPGGFAAIIMQEGEEKEAISGGVDETTNNRMELRAVIEGLKSFEHGSSIALYSDSNYVVKGLVKWLDNWKENGWSTSSGNEVKNKDLWLELENLRHKYDLSVNKVKAHADNELNNRADELAKKAIPQSELKGEK
ncbi:ribonuclease HI [Halarsenatibacter silvermanii]|uniref:Ribonuclease H n=1 Tax=Halarsenatibacter silvermanii TaxID=321763 RepID=A0A1G9JQC4_9FIRM|nr:ribonuclease HI [Halarsenatibacter silvermanii]SDL39334.1 ribonuclease HI [Halarsenatibacter silvermanii]